MPRDNARGHSSNLGRQDADGHGLGINRVADAGGNWMASFPSAVIRDYPNSVQISQSSAFYSLSDPHGYNLRTYFSPALNPGHFMFQELRMISEGGAAPLLGDLGIRNPLRRTGGDQRRGRRRALPRADRIPITPHGSDQPMTTTGGPLTESAR